MTSVSFFLRRCAIICLLPLLSCGCAYSGQASDQVPGQMAIQEMPLSEAASLWRSKDALFIDVRTSQEYEEGHVPGAILIPLQELEHRYQEIPHDKPVLLICRSARRSAQANLLLQQLGFSNTFSVKQGMIAWPEKITKD